MTRRVRSDACFRLDVAELRRMIDQGWFSGEITYTHGIGKHPHAYQRIGDGERGVLGLEYDTLYHGHQSMAARYALPPASHRLLWECPNQECRRMVRVLYRPHGGAYFLCRHCWHIGYASQYESASDRVWRRFDRAQAMLNAAPSPAQLVRADGLIRSALAAVNAETDRAHALIEAMQAEDARSPRRPGRPSQREAREAERAARAAARPVRSKLPPGRPRTRRAYHRRASPVLSPPQPDMVQAYCPRCRDRRELVAGVQVLFSNGRPAIRGRCAECETRCARLIPSSERRA